MTTLAQILSNLIARPENKHYHKRSYDFFKEIQRENQDIEMMISKIKLAQLLSETSEVPAAEKTFQTQRKTSTEK